jgi:hypothetical protein
MHSTDDKDYVPEKKPRWKKCPICFDTIFVSDTRPVRWFTGQESEIPPEGADIMLRLMMREQGSIHGLPRDSADAWENPNDIPWHSDAEVMDYARVMKASEDYMMAQFDLEIADIEVQGQDDELMYGDDFEWSRRAVNSVTAAKDRIKGMGNAPSGGSNIASKKGKSYEKPLQSISTIGNFELPVKNSDSRPISKDSSQRLSGARGDAIHPPFSGEENRSSMSVQPHASLALRPRRRGTDGQFHADTAYYFYQALPHFYLSPLDIRILKAAFHEYASFPVTILPRVEHVTTGHIIDDDLRKKAKYLGHLPAGCEVCFLECDWSEIVSKEVSEKFASEIDRRRKRNQEKAHREEKERLRAEKEEDDKRWGPHRRKRSTLSRPAETSSYGSPDAFPEMDMHQMSAGPSISPPQSSIIRQQDGSVYSSLASPSTSPATVRTVWGTAVVASSSPLSAPVTHQDHDVSDHDGWLQGWERDFFEDDSVISTPESKSGTGTPSGKKKKAKKITLMSTNARRGA